MSDLSNSNANAAVPVSALSRPGVDPASVAMGLIGTRTLPPGLLKMKELAVEANAYHSLTPYPYYAFTSWKSENDGPLPRCMPLAKSIVKRGAKWLFGRPVQLSVPGNTLLETTIKDAWRVNRMDSRMVAAAEKAAINGGVVLKYSIDENNKDVPVRIQTLDYLDEVRLFYNPHDRDQLLMARVQYPFFDAATNRSWWYREEWTAAEEVHYEPQPQQEFQASRSYTPDTFDGWQIISRAANPFGRIPVGAIRNLDTDDVWGGADLWNLSEGNGLYRILDRLNMAFFILDRSNQIDSQINPFIFDADVGDGDHDIDKPLQPGQPLLLESKEGSPHAARVTFPTGANASRPGIMAYIDDVRTQLYEAASCVEFDPEKFTNKGNLTEAVLELMFQLQIEITNEKRKSYGTDGLQPFFESFARGAQQAGMSLGVTTDPKSYQTTIKFAPYFVLSEDEKTARVARIQQEQSAGFTTHERAIDAVAHMEGVEDVAALKEELANEKPLVLPGAPVPTAPLPDEVPDQPGAVPVTNRPL